MNLKLQINRCKLLVTITTLFIFGSILPSRAEFENFAYESGWKQSPWLGLYWDEFDPWLFHDQHLIHLYVNIYFFLFWNLV